MLIFHNFSLVRFYSILKVPRGTIRPSPHRIKRWTHTMKTWQQNDTGERKDAPYSSMSLYAHEERPRDNGGQKNIIRVKLSDYRRAKRHSIIFWFRRQFSPPRPFKNPIRRTTKKKNKGKKQKSLLQLRRPFQ